MFAVFWTFRRAHIKTPLFPILSRINADSKSSIIAIEIFGAVFFMFEDSRLESVFIEGGVGVA